MLALTGNIRVETHVAQNLLHRPQLLRFDLHVLQFSALCPNDLHDVLAFRLVKGFHQTNDYSFKYLFSRNLESIGNKNDILIAISTSGNSQNI